MGWFDARLEIAAGDPAGEVEIAHDVFEANGFAVEAIVASRKIRVRETDRLPYPNFGWAACILVWPIVFVLYHFGRPLYDFTVSPEAESVVFAGNYPKVLLWRIKTSPTMALLR